MFWKFVKNFHSNYNIFNSEPNHSDHRPQVFQRNHQLRIQTPMISATNVDQILGVHTALPVIGLLTTWLLTFSIHKNKFVFLMKISFSQMMKSGHPIFNLPLYFRSNRLSSLYGSSSIVPKGSSARSITSSRSSKSRNKLKLYRPRSSCSIPGKAK